MAELLLGACKNSDVFVNLKDCDQLQLEWPAKKTRQMKAGQNNKYDMPKTSDLTCWKFWILLPALNALGMQISAQLRVNVSVEVCLWGSSHLFWNKNFAELYIKWQIENVYFVDI